MNIRGVRSVIEVHITIFFASYCYNVCTSHQVTKIMFSVVHIQAVR